MTLFDDVLDLLDQSEEKIGPRDFINQIKSLNHVSSQSAKKILQALINNQTLCYHYLYGNTYIERSFLKPVAITDHFTLTPPEFVNTSCGSTHFQLILHQGISFGSGQHPTTRLCLQAIDFCFFDNDYRSLKQGDGADIGTGSGVLALAMCLAGLGNCMAFEIDPVSANEAKKNIRLNNLEKQIYVHEALFQTDKNRFSIICANLRWPTLKSLSADIYNSLMPGGAAVLSGVRAWEKDDLIELYHGLGFHSVWQKDEKNWSAFVLIKKL